MGEIIFVPMPQINTPKYFQKYFRFQEDIHKSIFDFWVPES